ncbi:MAG TPA: hypothetical protein PKA41_14300, partial [Verrucomicrobiota bacterium]|nr:hypothetical protein [Verrucomicrobiota bacterium]
PTAACVFVALTLTRQPVGFSVATTQGELAAMSLSNQNYAPYLAGSFDRQQNRWDTFEWTNGGEFNSSKRPFSREQ